MHLKDIFQKPIDRDIQGVIKVGQDDESSIYRELEEYVVTTELRQRFESFFEAYKKGIVGYTDKIGVWISGFFGSGKSHYLKILSHLLSNKEVLGKKTVSFFEDKLKDPAILENMKEVSNITTDVILFNIDAKSDTDEKKQEDSILRVFNQVFNEMQGFCAQIPWLADLERHLMKDNVYGEFKKAFKQFSGRSWKEARGHIYYEEDSLIKALAQTSKMSERTARNWYQKAEENYSLSIEMFANRINEYIESKSRSHHVIFLIDEIGQYIGDDRKHLLNLQTLVEQLGIICRGKCWVIVTSQQQINSLTQETENDFSKIEGRFNTRLHLSSENVEEIIRKRILEKKEGHVKETLRTFYTNKRSIVNNLLTFKDTTDMKSYNDMNEFLDVYPFIPYQFNLLRKVLKGIRTNGAAGKSVSEGERSLLSAFQQCANLHAAKEVGALIPFSAFYETIEVLLDESLRSIISQAAQNRRLLKDDIVVLKLLLLVKFVNEMPTNLENIATLLANSIDEDKVEKMQSIQGSLQRLLRESLIQKNGEEYLFLTNEEQRINKEINHVSIDLSETIREIGTLIFKELYKGNKFQYSERYHFSFNTCIDNLHIRNVDEPFGIKVITPSFENISDLHEAELKSLSLREKNVIVKLPSETLVAIEEMEEAKKADAYIRKTSGFSISPAVEEIKEQKRKEATDRKKRVRTLLIEALKDASIYVNGDVLRVKAKQPAQRLNEALTVFIEMLYHKMNLISQPTESKQLLELTVGRDDRLHDLDNTPNKLALAEVHAYIKRNNERNIPITMKSLVVFFSNIPYGWFKNDIVACVIKLYKARKIELHFNEQLILLENKNIIDYLTKHEYSENVLIKEHEKVSHKLINNVKDICRELSDAISPPLEEDRLVIHFKMLIKEELYSVINKYREYCQSKNYPGKELLNSAEETFITLKSLTDSLTVYKMAYQLKGEIFNYIDDRKDIVHFFEEQQPIFDTALEKIKLFEKNKTYINDEKVTKIIDKMKTIVQNPSPYRSIYQLPGLIKEFDEKYKDLLERESEPIREVIEKDYKKVIYEIASQPFKDQLLSFIEERFNHLKMRLDCVQNVYEAIAMKDESDRLKLQCFNEIYLHEVELKQKQEETTAQHQNKVTTTTVISSEISTIIPRKTMINVSMANILKETTTVQDEQDIDQLLEELRERLVKELKEDKIIRLI
ncbi:BREX system P-loop protein BrxC [Alkalihalobacterium elongatum]|uniref:BREX system P-loop protein BrxC n=1 Tax=Alkalihalobacterium elongatum TaxID=2675466 RepID=UPI001C1F5959|nr:BREX system P-loop protein BrxC [Alkalihalobacterium elongatum]